MSCFPQQPLSTNTRIVAFLLSFVGLGLLISFYLYPTWTEFKYNGQKGTLGLREMCIHEADGSYDCRDIKNQDILFILFRLFSTLGLIGYTIFVITVSMTFCSCCIKSDKAKGITKFSVVVADLITFNLLMIAIATGLKSEFLGTLKISYGCIFCLTAFSITILLCPVYLIDAKNFATQYKNQKKYARFSDTQNNVDPQQQPPEPVSETKPTTNEFGNDLKYRIASTHM